MMLCSVIIKAKCSKQHHTYGNNHHVSGAIITVHYFQYHPTLLPPTKLYEMAFVMIHMICSAFINGLPFTHISILTLSLFLNNDIR